MHTLGPWELQKITNGYRIITGGIYTMNLDGPWYPSPAQAEAFEANARLIAAAPELLEALETALERLERHIAIGMFYETEIIREDLREAIRKARG